MMSGSAREKCFELMEVDSDCVPSENQDGAGKIGAGMAMVCHEFSVVSETHSAWSRTVM